MTPTSYYSHMTAFWLTVYCYTCVQIIICFIDDTSQYTVLQLMCIAFVSRDVDTSTQCELLMQRAAPTVLSLELQSLSLFQLQYQLHLSVQSLAAMTS